MTAHPSWCARDHRCGLGEHRSEPLVVDVAGVRLVLTRVRRRDGGDSYELRATGLLPRDEAAARRCLGRVLDVVVRGLGR